MNPPSSHEHSLDAQSTAEGEQQQELLNQDREPSRIELNKIRTFLRSTTPQTEEELLAYTVLAARYQGYSILDPNDPLGPYGSFPRAWANDTIFPGEEYKHAIFSPEGQCGVTNYGLGMILVWAGVADPENIFYEEGKLSGPDGELSDHHTWLRVKGKSGDEWRIDLAAYQYNNQNSDPDGRVRVVMQKLNGGCTGDYPGVNYRCTPLRALHSEKQQTIIPVPNAFTLTYNAVTSTPLKDYDTTQFGGRLERFMGRLRIKPGWAISRPAGDSGGVWLNNVWYPETYDIAKETITARFLGSTALADTVRLISESNIDEDQKRELLEEAHKDSLTTLVDEADLPTLRVWINEYMERALSYYETARPDGVKIREAIKHARGASILNLTDWLPAGFSPQGAMHDGDYVTYFTADMAERFLLSRYSYYRAISHADYRDLICSAVRIVTCDLGDEAFAAEVNQSAKRLKELIFATEDSVDGQLRRAEYVEASPEQKTILDIDQRAQRLEKLSTLATQETLLKWIEKCARVSLPKFQEDYPYDSILLKLIKKEAKDVSWERTDTFDAFAKTMFETDKNYQKHKAFHVAKAAATYRLMQQTFQLGRQDTAPWLRRNALLAAEHLALAARQDEGVGSRADMVDVYDWLYDELYEITEKSRL